MFILKKIKCLSACNGVHLSESICFQVVPWLKEQSTYLLTLKAYWCNVLGS